MINMTGLTPFALFVAVGLFQVWPDSAPLQTKALKESETTSSQERTAGIPTQTEVEVLISILKNKHRAASNQEIADAIERLGSLKDEKAIPILIENITFEKQFNAIQRGDPGSIDHWDAAKKQPSARFPATAALFQIGEAAVPGLVRLIERSSVGSLEYENALITIYFIFRDDLPKAVKILKKATEKASDPTGRQRLERALETTQHACRRNAKPGNC